jgi:excisionase family DNA binding protein
MSAPPQGLMSTAEVAAFLGVPASTLYTWHHKGTAPKSYRVGKHRKYLLGDVMAWLESNASNTAA